MCDQGRPLGMDTTAGAQGKRVSGKRGEEMERGRARVVRTGPGSLPSKVEYGVMLSGWLSRSGGQGCPPFQGVPE